MTLCHPSINFCPGADIAHIKNAGVTMISQKPAGNTISVCMIVRDEAENLERSLMSVKSVADEVIVADTGSRDSSPEIARKAGARVLRVQWKDDFSEARNASLAEAKGDWIFVLDADEELPAGEEDKLFRLLKDSKHEAYTVRIRSAVRSGGETLTVINTHSRIFRNKGEIRYSGRVHEDIAPSVRSMGGSIGDSGVELLHYGYAEEVYSRKMKAERNIRLLEKTIKENPTGRHAHFYLGEAYSLQNDWGKAIEYYKNALLGEGLEEEFRALARQNLATAYLRAGRYEECRSEARRALEIDNRLAAPYIIAGAAAFEEKRFDLTVFFLAGYLDVLNEERPARKSQPVRIEHSRALVYELLGRANYQTGNLETALHWFRMWEQEGGMVPPVRLWQARIYGEAGNFAEAEKLLADIGKEAANDPAVIAATGMLRIQQGRHADALELFRQSLTLNPASVDIRLELGKTYLALTRYGEACEILEEAWRMGRLDPATGQLLAESYVFSARYKEAEQTIASLKRAGIQTGPLEYLEGLLAKYAGNPESALNRFRNALSYSGLKPEFYFACGNALMELNQFAESIQAFEIAAQIAPSVKEPYYNAGVAHIKLKQYHEAIEKFETILKLEPDSKQIMKTLAGLYGKIGEMQKAEIYLYNASV